MRESHHSSFSRELFLLEYFYLASSLEENGAIIEDLAAFSFRGRAHSNLCQLTLVSDILMTIPSSSLALSIVVLSDQRLLAQILVSTITNQSEIFPSVGVSLPIDIPCLSTSHFRFDLK